MNTAAMHTTGVMGQSHAHESAKAQVLGAAPYLDDLAELRGSMAGSRPAAAVSAAMSSLRPGSEWTGRLVPPLPPLLLFPPLLSLSSSLLELEEKVP